MDFIAKSQREIESQLSSMGYRFVKEIQLSGQRFMCDYVNSEKKKLLQIVYELYAYNAFCKKTYIVDIEV